MRRYFFHLFNDVNALDEEGVELPNDAAALQKGKENALAMAADSVRHGRLVMDHRIEVKAEGGDTIGTIYFRDVVQVLEHAQGTTALE